MVDVFGAEEAGCFGPPEWGRRLKILECFRQSMLGFGDCLRVVLIVCL